MKFKSMRFFVALMVLWGASGGLFAATPKVVVSIAPLHSLVAGVMEGVGTPTLLLKGAASPHDHALRPSEVAALADADIVFWVGTSLEGFLEKPLRTSKARHVALIETASVRYPAREGGVWGKDRHAHKHKGHNHGGASTDPHVWLDPVNAGDMVDAVARELSALDAENSKRYEANAAALRQRLTALNHEIETMLTPVKRAPFIVFHDGYQYFEKRYGLNGVGAITVNPEQKPSAQRLRALRDTVQKSGVACVFAEPQYSDGLVKSIVEGTTARYSIWDPLGSNVAPGMDVYFLMMRQLAENGRRCLSGIRD
ncbi:MAG: zinc ABC transporter substrate-binding protein [Proteobacteria bacterium]|nr:zinc ABC transporter substrate-binding protein [Pseudomonadota bacterium]MCL2308174.1 zinc ABC transporter substrate-binding protein [Pseudomonadota bacterium]